MELISNYMLQEELRHKLNELTRKTFCFDFENWVTGGYFEGDYIPYSLLEHDKIISNVSVNRMSFLQNGVRREYIQLGTVMTDEAYRNKGLAKRLMEHILKEYQDQYDGIYLFANLSALGFYRKFGFREALEHRYSLKPEYCGVNSAVRCFQPVDTTDPVMKQYYKDTVRCSAANAALEQMNKYGLQMFYTADLSNVFYAEDIDCFAVMEKEEDTLYLQSILSKDILPIRQVIERIPEKYAALTLGFAPRREDAELFTIQKYDGGDDYRLFYLGSALESIEREQLIFPKFSHA